MSCLTMQRGNSPRYWDSDPDYPEKELENRGAGWYYLWGGKYYKKESKDNVK